MVTTAERLALMASAAQPKPPPEPYAENAEWEAERDVLLARSDRRAWAVAAAATVIAIASILALVAHGACYQTVAVPIVVDKATGETAMLVHENTQAQLMAAQVANEEQILRSTANQKMLERSTRTGQLSDYFKF